MTRRAFTACLTMVALLCLCLAAGCQDEEQEPDIDSLNEGPTYRAFETAAIELEVPLGLLMAIGYVETQWRMLAGGPGVFDSEGSGWGVMGLSEGRTLERAAEAVGSTLDDVRYDLELNVRAAAALFSISAADTLGEDYAERAALGDYRDVLADYARFSDPETTIAYVQAVMECLRDGAGKVLGNGEIVELVGEGDAVYEQAYGEG